MVRDLLPEVACKGADLSAAFDAGLVGMLPILVVARVDSDSARLIRARRLDLRGRRLRLPLVALGAASGQCEAGESENGECAGRGGRGVLLGEW